jgi:hypothetical protein
MSETEKTDWMSAKAFVQYLDDNKLQSPMYAWKFVELLRMHSMKKIVMEQGHPLHPDRFAPLRTNDGARRPVTRYTFRKQVKDSMVGGVCMFQVTKKLL